MHENRLNKIDSLNSERGYSLLEVVFAMAIFAVGILAIASMQTAALMSNSTARGVTEGVNLAHERVEQLMAIEYDPSNPDDDLDPANNAAHNAVDGDYSISWVCNNHPTIANALNINVFVTWWESAGQPARVQFDFIKIEEM